MSLGGIITAGRFRSVTEGVIMTRSNWMKFRLHTNKCQKKTLFLGFSNL